jgi:hypothetical protein
MAGPMQKVKRGDPLVIPASTFNTFVDAARDFQDRQRSGRRGSRGETFTLPADCSCRSRRMAKSTASQKLRKLVRCQTRSGPARTTPSDRKVS